MANTTIIDAYLNVPPPVACPGLINKPFKTFSVVLIQALGVPYEVGLEGRIVEKVHRPIPERVEVYIELELLPSVFDGDDLFLKLFNMQPQFLVGV